MPKAKINSTSSAKVGGAGVSRTPVKINSTSTPLWYKILMFAFMLVGLAWLVVNYVAGPSIPFMVKLNAWNYVIGFGLFVVGLLMTMGWK